MEYLDLYDENRTPIGQKIIRGVDKVEEGKYINIVIVFIENSEGKFLIQKTSKRKGSVFATTGGLVSSGYTPDETIIKEIKEELGLDVKIDELTLFYTAKRKYSFQDAYYLKKDIDINELILQEDEVEYVKWLSIEEINKLIENNEFREGNIKSFNKLIEDKNNENT